jgi:divalent metal cation (Fe/Co/Zn/Cd) transporter
MRRYTQVSGLVFGLVAVGQLIRAVMRWPVQVADVVVPVWASGCAFVVMAALATWAFSTAKRIG